MSIASQLSFGNAAVLTTGTLSGDRGVTAGSATTSFVEYNGTTATSGQFDGGSTAPSATTRLNYNGNLHATNFVGSLTGAATTSGTVTTAAQPNITSVGTLSSLAVTANANVGNLNSSGRVIATDNMIVTSSGGEGGQLILGWTGVGGITGQANSTWNMDVDSSNNFRLFYQNATGGTGVALSANSTSNLITTIGNISAPFFIGNGSQLTGIVAAAGAAIVNGNSNVTVTANSNVTVFVAGNTTARWTATSTGIVANGTYSISGNANIGNLGTAQVLATANVTAPQLISNIATGTAPFIVTSTTQVANLSVATAGTATSATSATNAAALLQNTSTATTVYPTFSTSGSNGNSSAVISTGISANLSNNAITATTFVGALSGAATTAGTVTTAAQPNITSVGTLTSLGVNGTVTAVAFTANTGVFTGNGSGLSAIAGANVTGTVASATAATNASALLQNTSTATTVYPTFSTSGANGNSSAVISTGISANLGNNAITATTFVGALSGAATSATTAGTVTTAAQPNITSVGTLTSLGVNGTVTAVAFTANTGVFTGNGNGLSSIVGANVTGTVASATAATNASALLQNTSTATSVFPTFSTSSANGNSSAVINTGISANLGNASITATTFVGALSGAATSATTAGTVTTAAQPNITSVGTLTSVAVTGNVTAGNVYANSGTIGASLLTGTLTTAAQPNITSVGTLTSATVTGNVAAGNLTTTGVLSVTGTGVSSIAGNLDMTSNTIINLATPTASTDAATKQYVDDVAQGLNIHPSCNAATTTTLASISGGTITYNNGTAGVGATLTTTGSYTTIDGVTLSNGMRILVKNEATQANNGIYVRTSATVLTRATDFDSAVEIAGGDFTFVTAGTLYNSTGWVQIDEVTTVGTDPIVWEQFSGAGTYQAGTGLTLTGTTFSVNASQTQVTAVGTLTGLNSSGTITAPAFTANTGIFTGNGSGLSAIAGANVTGTVSSATSATTAGTVTTAAQPNITSVGTLTSLGVNGTVTAVAFTANTGVFTGNGNGLSSIVGANVTGTVSSATTAGTVTTAAQPNITSVGTLTSLGVNGTITGTRLISNIATGTAPLTVTSTTRVANLNVDYANVADFISVAAGTGNNFLIFANAATGNISELTSTGLTANLSNNSITATTFVGSLSGAATTAGTVTTAAQPNITSVGTLTSLAVSGTSNLNAVGNVTITGGTNGQVLTTNGSGGLSWTTVAAGGGASISNGTSNVNIVASGGNVNTSVGGTANVLVVTATGANITGTANVSGNANVGNLGTAGQIISSIATGTAPFTVASTTKVVNLNAELVDGFHADQTNTANTIVVRDTNGNIAVGNITSTGNLVTGGGSGGNISGVNVLTATTLIGTFANGNSDIAIPAANGNILFDVAGNANVIVMTGTGANVNGTLTISTAANVPLVQNGTSNVAIASGANVTLGVAGTARITATSAGGNVNGTLGVSGNANVGNIGGATGIFTTAANTPLVQNGTSNVAIASGANVTLGVAGTTRITATSTGANVTGTLGVSGILTGSANVSGTNVISSAYQISSVNAAVSAAGTTQGTGTVLATQFNVVSTVASGAGVVLPVAVAGMRITVLNTSANALLVYPASTGIINSQAANASYSQPAGSRLDYISTSTTQWYTLNATYG